MNPWVMSRIRSLRSRERVHIWSDHCLCAGFLAFADNQLYHLADEPVHKKRCFATVNWKDGKVSVEEIFFCQEHNLSASRAEPMKGFRTSVME